MQYIIAILFAITIYFLQFSLYRRYWDISLDVRISYSKAYANIGDTLELTEQIANKKLLPLPVLYVKFCSSRTFQYETDENASLSDHYYRNDIFSILGNQQVTRKQLFRTTQRGYFVIDSVNLVSHDLFLRNSFATILNNYAALYVYPKRLCDRQALALTSSIIGNITKKTLFEDPLLFRSIREYTTQDGMRYINWKATARNQQLMVNTHFDTQSVEVVLLLNLDTHAIKRSEQLQEYLISVVTTLLYHITDRGLAVRLAVNLPDSITGESIVTALGTGNEHLHLLLQTLAKLDLSSEPIDFLSFFNGTGSLFPERINSTFFLIISNYHRNDLLQQYRQKRKSGYQALFICPEYNQPLPVSSDILFWKIAPEEL